MSGELDRDKPPDLLCGTGGKSENWEESVNVELESRYRIFPAMSQRRYNVRSRIDFLALVFASCDMRLHPLHVHKLYAQSSEICKQLVSRKKCANYTEMLFQLRVRHGSCVARVRLPSLCARTSPLVWQPGNAEKDEGDKVVPIGGFPRNNTPPVSESEHG